MPALIKIWNCFHNCYQFYAAWKCFTLPVPPNVNHFKYLGPITDTILSICNIFVVLTYIVPKSSYLESPLGYRKR